jgi:hypothetical protein
MRGAGVELLPLIDREDTDDETMEAYMQDLESIRGIQGHPIPHVRVEPQPEATAADARRWGCILSLLIAGCLLLLLLLYHFGGLSTPAPTILQSDTLLPGWSSALARSKSRTNSKGKKESRESVRARAKARAEEQAASTATTATTGVTGGDSVTSGISIGSGADHEDTDNVGVAEATGGGICPQAPAGTKVFVVSP